MTPNYRARQGGCKDVKMQQEFGFPASLLFGRQGQRRSLSNYSYTIIITFFKEVGYFVIITIVMMMMMIPITKQK